MIITVRLFARSNHIVADLETYAALMGLAEVIGVEITGK